jgi:hypothetical protein
MVLLTLLLACGPPDPDATGPRWDTATTTPRPPRDTGPTTEPADTGTSVPTADTGPDLCTGWGEPVVEVGQGSLLAFEPYVDGDGVQLTTGPYGDLGFSLNLLTTGFDTRDDMSAVLRLDVDGTAQDYLSLVIMNCPVSGPGWVQVHAPLDDALEARALAGDLAGAPVSLALTLTDVVEDEDTFHVELVVE